ncbi:cytochrome P450 [Jimgerdemannia flammicorona]|uniref:Cytochrome P450 n=1 Tax=Jimgerdemannia flammicorona TaxID=994334 RepID=A0A433B923_9FUNG|nr:cytochrome P450 [Jimgerdemannia flammicorona]
MKDALFDTAADAGTEIDFHDILFKYTLDSFVRIGFGTELGALKQKEKLPFAIAFDAAQTQIAQRHIFPFWQTAELANRIFRPWRSTMDDYVKVVNNFAHEVVEQRRNDPDKEKRSDLLSRFMNTRDENGNILNDTQLRDIVLNFIIAGRDTTAQAISWTFYELARHPEIEEKLLAEVLDSINEDMTPNQLYEAIKEMKYAHAVFYEVLRHYPSVPVNQKYALTDDVWPDGTHIKAGDYVMWCPHAQGRLEAVWGADAKEFRPERWLIDGSLRKVSQGEWPAFHGGPRVCLGEFLRLTKSSDTGDAGDALPPSEAVPFYADSWAEHYVHEQPDSADEGRLAHVRGETRVVGEMRYRWKLAFA